MLEDFRLAVAPGEVVALTGPSGCGKSTVADLLIRHMDPDRGRVLLDGTDIRAVALADLRARVAVVEQGALVFNTSILENVRYARPGADPAEVMRAVERAGLGAFVATLPDGLDTLAGERVARRSRRASGSGSRSRGRCSPIPPSWSWTRPQARWTRPPRRTWSAPTAR